MSYQWKYYLQITAISRCFLTVPAVLVATQVAWTCSRNSGTENRKLSPSFLTGIFVCCVAELEIITEVEGAGLPATDTNKEMYQWAHMLLLPSAVQDILYSLSFTITSGAASCIWVGSPRMISHYMFVINTLIHTKNISTMLCFSSEPQALYLCHTHKLDLGYVRGCRQRLGNVVDCHSTILCSFCDSLCVS